MSVAIVDYGSGNLRSAAKAFERAAGEAALDMRIAVTADAAALDSASHIVLPGVGAFRDCMAGLSAVSGMLDALQRNVIGAGKPFLGICVGMQLMATRGLEYGAQAGLDWIPGDVTPLAPDDPALKVPHMGWNELEIRVPDHPVFRDIDAGAHAYFVHSYALRPSDSADILAEVDYGEKIVAVVGRDNMVGTQFHPEKSQKAGLILLRNFLKWRA